MEAAFFVLRKLYLWRSNKELRDKRQETGYRL